MKRLALRASGDSAGRAATKKEVGAPSVGIEECRSEPLEPSSPRATECTRVSHRPAPEYSEWSPRSEYAELRFYETTTSAWAPGPEWQ